MPKKSMIRHVFEKMSRQQQIDILIRKQFRDDAEKFEKLSLFVEAINKCQFEQNKAKKYMWWAIGSGVANIIAGITGWFFM